ncbi:hypothetical protein IHE33_15155 (plasmid) [Mycetohabitans endofungorum]|uniref:hypothetical protein n=1 Tax=Mycetohabitans endofungorum TaxID=417203 RepID=UPI0030CFA736
MTSTRQTALIAPSGGKREQYVAHSSESYYKDNIMKSYVIDIMFFSYLFPIGISIAVGWLLYRSDRQRDESQFDYLILTILIGCLIIVLLLTMLSGELSRQTSIEHKRTVAYPEVLSFEIKAQ